MTVRIEKLGPGRIDCRLDRQRRTLFDGPFAVDAGALTEEHGLDRVGLLADFRPEQSRQDRRSGSPTSGPQVPRGWSIHPSDIHLAFE